MTTISKWDKRFLETAKHYSAWSKDPSKQIGAIAVSVDRQILSIGYNGFPRNILDNNERLHDRQCKYSYMVHAEQNVIYNACYNGVSLRDSTLYVYGLPVCGECSKGIVQVGIKRVVCCYETFETRWMESVEQAERIFNEVGIEFIYHMYKDINA